MSAKEEKHGKHEHEWKYLLGEWPSEDWADGDRGGANDNL
jgi:hypothetical protein